MPKSRTRKRKKSGTAAATSGGGNVQWGGASQELKPATKGILGLVAVAIVGGIGWFAWNAFSVSQEFDALIEAGQPALGNVVSTPSLGRRHLAIGENYSYREGYPTSGPHDQTWVSPGFYTRPQLPTRLVHAAEHGNIVIYYNNPGDEVIETLKSWAGLYSGQWDGIVVTRNRSLGASVVLTAWRKRLRLPSFDAASAAAFIDAFRGRGPENKVR